MRTIAACALARKPVGLISLPYPPRLPRDDLFLRCLVLAVLVHVWLALTLGTKPGPSVAGSGGWGDIAITLQGLGGPATDGQTEADAQVWRDDGPLGDARSTRYGGRVRPVTPPPDSGPGAQRQGRWQAQEVAEAPDRPDDEPNAARGSSPTSAKVEPPAPVEASTETMAVPTPERTLPADVAPRPLVSQALGVESLKTPAAPELAPVTATVALPDPLLRSLVDPSAPQASTRGAQAVQAPKPTLPAAELRPTTAQVEVPTPEPVLRSLETPSPVRTVVRSNTALAAPKPAANTADLAPVQARVELPPEQPVLKSLGGTALPKPSPRSAQALEPLKATASSDIAPVAARVDVPEPAPVLKTLGGDSPSPRRLPRDDQARAPMNPLAPSAAAPALRPLDPLALPQAAAAPEGASASASSNVTPAAGDPVTTPTPGPRMAAGSPDAGAQVGHDVATAPSASASAPPRPLNLTLPRTNGPTARQSSGLLALLPAVPDTKSKLEKSIEAAQREDCRKAHADKGLLGALPLALDSARGKGCKW